VREQSPQCEAYGETTDIDLTFLGAGTKKGEFLISHDNTEGWIVNVGAVQGVPPSGAIFLLKDGREVRINSVKTNYSTIEAAAFDDTEEQHPVTLKNVEAGLLTIPVLRLAFSKDSDKRGIDVLKERLANMSLKAIQIVENENDTDYVIRAYNNAYRLCKRGDTVPLFKRQEGYTISTAQLFLRNIETISKWRAKLELDNALTTISDSEFEINVLDITDNPLPRPYVLKQVDETTAFRVKVGIKNVGSRNYWVSALYIGSDFSVSNEFLTKKEIKPNETAWIEYKNQPSVPFNVQKEYRSWGVNEIQEYFKIFISTDPIDTSIHNQKGLQLDTYKEIGEATPDVPMNDWRTILVPLTVVCPLTSRDVVGGSTVQMFDAEIIAPQGFSAKMNAASTMQATAQASRSVKSVPILRGGVDMSPAAFAEGLSNSPPLDVLEIKNATGTISYDKPLKIKLKNIKENETVLSFGFDAATSLYLPLGISDATGTVNINHLPEAEEEEISRSLGSSAINALKIYFKKMVNPVFGGYDYPLLRMAKFTDNAEEMTYETDKAVIQKAVSEANSVLLFVHGLIGATDSNAKALVRASQAIGEQGIIGGYDVVLTFDYESLNTTIENTAADLEKRLSDVGITPPSFGVSGKRCDIMAHSMGCLVSRHFVERLSGSKIVQTLYLFGAPNSGSTLAELKNMIGTGLTLAVNGLSFLQPYIVPLSLLGKGLETMLVTIGELDPKSAFITDLNNAPDTGIRYYATAGNVELMQKTQPQQHTFYQKVINSLKKTPDNMLNNLFGEPHDMAVPVRSVHSVGKQSNVVFREIACDHFNFFEVNSVGLMALIEEVKGEEEGIM
jgi:triacylglycerol esterase/lipase EstA (alpha/beta hydrolase family)